MPFAGDARPHGRASSRPARRLRTSPGQRRSGSIARYRIAASTQRVTLRPTVVTAPRPCRPPLSQPPARRDPAARPVPRLRWGSARPRIRAGVVQPDGTLRGRRSRADPEQRSGGRARSWRPATELLRQPSPSPRWRRAAPRRRHRHLRAWPARPRSRGCPARPAQPWPAILRACPLGPAHRRGGLGLPVGDRPRTPTWSVSWRSERSALASASGTSST